ncbi:MULTISPECIES: lysophospholipid acyltransferase family protein [unclassified Luteococcus]|uniref:lysophospholipid acyltransferase family protein n=1 Tax=unclassified Luteococcus TaxID=2639923 RepID=UPI00313E0273
MGELDIPRQIPDLSVLPTLHTPLLKAFRAPVRGAFQALWRVEIHHPERIPQGRAILAFNHVGILDGPLAVAVSRDSQAMAKMELWRSKPLATVLDGIGQIPIDRWHPDPRAIRRCVQVLQADRKLVIFPESHRGRGDFTHFKRGTAYLAMVTGAPVVPVALVGSAVGGTGLRSLPRPRQTVHVVYSEPVAVPAQEWPRRAGEVADLTERLRTICAQHVQQAQREVGLELP